MTVVRVEEFECRNCGKSFDVKFIEHIVGTMMTGLREKVLNFKLFDRTCPHCGKKNEVKYHFFYHDMNQNFKVMFGDESGIMCNYFINKRHAWDDLDIKSYAATSYEETVSTIVLLENQLDPHVGMLHLQKQILQYLDSRKDEDIKLKKAYYSYAKNGQLQIVFVMDMCSKGTTEVMNIPFDRAGYEQDKEKYGCYLEKCFPYIINSNVYNSLLTSKKEDVEEMLQKKERGYYVLTPIQEYFAYRYFEQESQKPAIGDKVSLLVTDLDGEKNIVPGEVVEEMELTNLDINGKKDYPIIFLKKEALSVETKEESSLKDTRRALINQLEKNKKDTNTPDVAGYNFCVAVQKEDEEPDFYVGEQGYCFVSSKNNLLRLYAEKKESKKCEYLVLHGLDIVRIFVRNPKSCAGIAIEYKDIKAYMTMDIAIQLLGLYRFMADPKRMLLSFTKEDIELFGNENYEVLMSSVFSRKTGKEFLEEIHVETEEEKEELIWRLIQDAFNICIIK